MSTDGLYIFILAGDHVKITVSQNPLVTVARSSSTSDWFHSLQCSLQWNVRMRQKSFLVLEEDDKPKPAVASSPAKDESSAPEDGLFGCLHDGKRQQKQSNDGNRTNSSSTSTSANNSESTTAYNSEDEDEDDDSVVLPEWSTEELQPPNPFAKCVKE